MLVGLDVIGVHRNRAAPLALAVVLALADVRISRRLGVGLLLVCREPGAGRHAGHDGSHDLRELSTIHSISSLGCPASEQPSGCGKLYPTTKSGLAIRSIPDGCVVYSSFDAPVAQL